MRKEKQNTVGSCELFYEKKYLHQQCGVWDGRLELFYEDMNYFPKQRLDFTREDDSQIGWFTQKWKTLSKN